MITDLYTIKVSIYPSGNGLWEYISIEKFEEIDRNSISFMQFIYEEGKVHMLHRQREKWNPDIDKIFEEMIHQCLPDPKAYFATAHSFNMGEYTDEDHLWRLYFKDLLLESTVGI